MPENKSNTVNEPPAEDVKLAVPIVEMMRNNNQPLDQNNSDQPFDQNNSDNSSPNFENIDVQIDAAATEAPRQLNDAESESLYKWLGDHLDRGVK